MPGSEVVICDFPDGFFPYEGRRIKEFFEELKADFAPDVVFTHQRDDLHQDHRLTCELTWNTFRDHLILEYEVPKYDGDMGAPNTFVPLAESLAERKIDHLMDHFASQRSKHWFQEDLFSSLLRLRGMECNSRELPRRGVLLPQGRARVTAESTGRPEALVTGASSGIGAATCRKLREQGWHVAGVARRPSDAASVSLELDITRLDDLEGAFKAVPHLELLVHSAGTIRPVGPLLESDPDEWRRAVEVNLIGTYNVLRAGLAGGLASTGGRAIHITTGAASSAKPYWSAYAASKAGAEHLVRSAAADLGDNGCAVCALDPGITETAMQEEVRTLDFPDRERFVRAHEEGTSRSPEEVAAAVCELARREPEDSERTDVPGGGPVIGAAANDVGREAHALARDSSRSAGA